MELVTNAAVPDGGPSAWEETCLKVCKLAEMEAVTRPKLSEVLVHQADELAEYSEAAVSLYVNLLPKHLIPWTPMHSCGS